MKKQFSSIFSDEINEYIEIKVKSGYKYVSFINDLGKFDNFCIKEKVLTKRFSKENCEKWMQSSESEYHTSHYHRINSSKLFLKFLSNKGFDIFIPADIKYHATDFKPHIYSTEEISAYFKAVDSFSSLNPKDSLQYPVLFRIIFTCGTRINETLGIRKRDVDLESGIIKLFETKNSNYRYIVLKEDMLTLLKAFANKCFYWLKDDDYIFTNSVNRRIDSKTVYNNHRSFLKAANIPYLGNGEGPRIHDWRHHMAVYSFKQLSDSGVDMYASLPILSTFLGHKTIYATEKYLHMAQELFPAINKINLERIGTVFSMENENENETN